MATRSSASTATRPPSDDAKAIDLLAWLFLLREKWRLILLSVLGMLALAGVYLFLKTPVYTAQAVIQVTEDATNVIDIKAVDPENYKSDIALKSVEGAFNSGSLLVRVAKANNLEAEDAAFRPAAGEPPRSDAELAEIMQRKTEAKLQRGTRLVSVSFDSTNAERAAKVARSLIDEYLKT